MQPPSSTRFHTNGRNKSLHNSTSAMTTATAQPLKLALPPRYGVSVVATPPPTVRLYVSDVATYRSTEVFDAVSVLDTALLDWVNEQAVQAYTTPDSI